MTEADVVEVMRAYLSTQFPKKCQCGRLYSSLEDYLRNTTHTGKPISYDADMENWQPKLPIGTVSMANCSCGSTLAVSSKGMNLITLLRLMFWARIETRSRGIGMSELLEDLRSKVDKVVLQGGK
jgi:hypothetical protein